MRDKNTRRLPTVKYKGKKYFIDWRLREFRTVDLPLEFVSIIFALLLKFLGADFWSSNVAISMPDCENRKNGVKNDRNHFILDLLFH